MAAAAVGSRVVFSKEGGFHVEINTDRLSIRSVQESDKDFYTTLFSNIDVMTRFSDGKARPAGNIEARVNAWITRWQQGNPFSALIVFEKRSDETIPFGHIVLGYGSSRGAADLSYFLMPTHYEYEEEMVRGVVTEYAQRLKEGRYSVEGSPFQTVTTAVKFNNDVSTEIVKKLGMQLVFKHRTEDGPFNYSMHV